MFEPIAEYISNYQSKGYYPGAVVSILYGSSYHFFCCGRLTPDPASPKVDVDTLFDIASITKPLATTTAVLQLIEGNQLDLDIPAYEILPECARDPGKKAVTIRHLLTHTSGLPAWKPLYIFSSTRPGMIETIAKTPLEAVPGTRVEYSCLGFILLGEIVRRITGDTLTNYCSTSIFKPLGMDNTLFNPPASLKDRIAPTEMGNAFERCLAGDAGRNYTGWRSYRLHGEVQDANAWLGDGESGNAGVFSTAKDLTRFSRCMLNGGKLENRRILTMAAVESATRNQTPGLNMDRGLGWQMASSSTSAGSRFSPHAYGHNGFSGTSLWIDPEHELAVIFLTNRAWYGGSGEAFGKIRGPFHDQIIRLLEASR